MLHKPNCLTNNHDIALQCRDRMGIKLGFPTPSDEGKDETMKCDYCGAEVSALEYKLHYGGCQVKHAKRVDNVFPGDKALDYLKASANLCHRNQGAFDCVRPAGHEGECVNRRNASPIPPPSAPLANANPAKRQGVDYRYDALNWDFVKMMAQIAVHADEKHGDALQYLGSELTKDKGPVNHIAEHLRQFVTGEIHDHFGTRAHQLAAIAYNAMMAYAYLRDNPDYELSPMSRTKGEVGP